MTECVSPRPSSFSDGESPARPTSDSPVQCPLSEASVTGGSELPGNNLAAGYGSPGDGSPADGSADGYSSVAGTQDDAARGEDERTTAAAANDLCLDGHKAQAELLAKVP